MQWLYLIGLIFSIACLIVVDYRYKLALWYDKRRTLLTVGIGVLVFITWDLLGIQLGIFFHGNSVYTLPVRLLPEFPVEELFFLLLLCYCTLLIFRGSEKIWRRT